MQPGSTFIDMTSLNPIASKEIAAELAARGIQMLDAPVSGGEPKAIDGTLSFMVGGEEEVFSTFKPVLLAMGSSAVRGGGIGAGNTTCLLYTSMLHNKRRFPPVRLYSPLFRVLR